MNYNLTKFLIFLIIFQLKNLDICYQFLETFKKFTESNKILKKILVFIKNLESFTELQTLQQKFRASNKFLDVFTKIQKINNFFLVSLKKV